MFIFSIINTRVVDVSITA